MMCKGISLRGLKTQEFDDGVILEGADDAYLWLQ